MTTAASGGPVALTVIDGQVIKVEAEIDAGLPMTILTGLPDTELREARDRIRAAIVNSGLPWPQSKISVKLSPAIVPEPGCGYDLAIAVAVLAACGAVPTSSAQGIMFVAELGLDGALRPVPGVRPAVLAAAAAGASTVAVAAKNAAEAHQVPGLRLIAACCLADLVIWLARQPGCLQACPSVHY